MHFQQRIKLQLVFGDRAHVLKSRIIENGGDQENGIGACHGCFVNLDRIDGEILPQDWQSCACADRNEIIDGTAKIFFLS